MQFGLKRCQVFSKEENFGKLSLGIYLSPLKRKMRMIDNFGSDLKIGIVEIIRFLLGYVIHKFHRIKIQFAHSEMAHDVWNLLSKCCSTTDAIHQYRLHEKLHNMRQLSDQPINDFLPQMRATWDQLALAERTWKNVKDAEKYFNFHDNL